jgi:hypothetical protein
VQASEVVIVIPGWAGNCGTKGGLASGLDLPLLSALLLSTPFVNFVLEAWADIQINRKHQDTSNKFKPIYTMYNIIRYSQNISNGKNFRLLQCSGT